jgi:osmotically-inducible protein OsmY
MTISTSATPIRLAASRARLRSFAALVLVAALASACSSGRVSRPATDDSGISTRVRTALLNDPEVAANSINVTANNGVVTLSGSVRTAAERDRAVAVARQTSGVADVRSELAVSQP